MSVSRSEDIDLDGIDIRGYCVVYEDAFGPSDLNKDVVRDNIGGNGGFNNGFFFQAEDGIRDRDMTGVQTCALPIWGLPERAMAAARGAGERWIELRRRTRGGSASDPARTPRLTRQPRPRSLARSIGHAADAEIGRASCRERV